MRGRRLTRITAGAFAAAGVSALILAGAAPVGADTSTPLATYAVTGSISFSPSLTQTGTAGYTLTLGLTEQGGAGPATGTLTATGAVANGGCAAASGNGTASVTWTGGGSSTIGFSMQTAGAGVYLNGLVNPSSVTFAYDLVNAALTMAPSGPSACAGGGITTVSVSGQMAFSI